MYVYILTRKTFVMLFDIYNGMATKQNIKAKKKNWKKYNIILCT
jgi:hypothetical protein